MKYRLREIENNKRPTGTRLLDENEQMDMLSQLLLSEQQILNAF